MFSLKELPDIQGVFKVCQISPSFLAVFFFMLVSYRRCVTGSRKYKYDQLIRARI